MSDLLLPNGINLFLAVQASGVFWLLNNFIAGCIALFLFQGKKLSSGGSSDAFSRAGNALKDAVLQPVTLITSYSTTLLQFLITNLSWVIFAIFISAVSFVLLNYQQGLIVLIDDTYENLYSVAIMPVKTAINLFVLIIQIVLGLINFVSQYTSSVFLDSTTILMKCPGYFDSMFMHFSYGASVISSFMASLTSLMNNKLVGPLEMRTVVKPMRLMAYDALLRFKCACPADRGVLDILQTGLFDSTSVNVDSLIHYGINSILSVPQVVLATVVASSSSGTYVAPNTDYVFDNFVGLTNYTEKIANALFINGVGFVEGLITQASSGTSSAQWPPIPVFSIFGRIVVLNLEMARVAVRTMMNAPDLLVPGNFARRGYILLDGRYIYQAELDVSDAIWAQNFGGLYKNALKKTGFALRDLTNVGLAHTYWAYEGILRLLLGRVQGVPFLYGTPPFTGICYLESNQDVDSGFQNFWSAIFDITGEYDRLVKTSFITFASSLNNAAAPYYPPIAMSGGLATVAWANFQSMMIRKNIYILYAMMTRQPPSYVCMSSLSRPTRVAIDNLIESLGDFTSFFLDIEQAQNYRNAHFNCKDHNVQNFIYAGSLKSHYFATKMCNTRYVDGTLVQCDYFNAENCPTYAIAYTDLNVNLLCAANEVIVQFLKTAIINERIASGFAEKQFTTAIACLINRHNTTTCPANNYVGIQSTVQVAAVTACASQELIVKVSNTFSALVSFGFEFAYDRFFGYGYVPGGENVNQKGEVDGTFNTGTRRGNMLIKYNEMTATAPEVQAFVLSRSTAGSSTADPSCLTTGGCCKSAARQVSNAQCVDGGAGNLCQWNGGGVSDPAKKCTLMSAQHLSFQQYPLEAATSTLMISVLSGLMWSNYLAFEQASRLAKAMELDPTLSTAAALANMITKVWTLLSEDQYFIVLESARVSILYGRDVIIGVVEFIRTFVFVFEGGNLPTEFIKFEKVMINIVDFIQQVAILVINDGFDVLLEFSKIIMDFVNIIRGGDVKENLTDALLQVKLIVGNQLGMFTDFVKQLPGIAQICKFFADLVDLITSGITTLTNVAIDALNGIITFLNGLLNFVTSGLTSFWDLITAGYIAAVKFAKDAIDFILTPVNVIATAVKPFVGWLQRYAGRRHLLGGSYDHHSSSDDPGPMAPIFPSPPPPPSIFDTNPTLNAAFSGLSFKTYIPNIKHITISNPANCSSDLTTIRPTEATLCAFNSDCTKTTSYCFVDIQNQCNESKWYTENVHGGVNMNDAWDKPCACSQLTSKNAYCDYASGFCREGISPFGDPISSCPAAGLLAFRDDTDYLNAMCWLFPAWKCNGKTDAALTNCINNNLNSNAPSVTGPHLCRDFCSPDLFNMDNKLIDNPLFGCVCAVGWSVALGQDPPNYASSFAVGVNGVSGRRLQHSDFNSSHYVEIVEEKYDSLVDQAYALNNAQSFYEWQYYDPHYNISLPQTVNGTTFCIEDNDCLVPTTTCESDIGRRACASCPTRNFYSFLMGNETGHGCRRGRCVCDSIPSIPESTDFSKVRWAGTSRCALLGRAYGNLTDMSTIVYVELRTCMHKHLAGLVLGHALRMPTLNPAVMYDNGEAMRFGAHLTVGLMVGGLFYNESDNRLWTIFSKLAIDPNIALPATRITGALVNATIENFPQTIKTSRSFIKFIVNMVGTLTILPSVSDVTTATSFITNTTGNVIAGVLEHYQLNATQSMQDVYDEIQDFRKTVFDYETRRRLLATVNVMPLSCPILVNFVTEFGTASNNLITHMTINIPRSVCRMTSPGGGDAWASCPPASWQLPLPASTKPPPPPRPPPPPKLAYPPPPGKLSLIVPKKLSNGGFIQSGIFSIIKALSGFDFASWVENKVNNLILQFPTKTDASTKITETINSVKCTFDSAVMCRDKNGTLLHNIVNTAIKFIIIIAGVSFLKFSFLTPAVVTLCLIMFYPTVMSNTYHLPIGCSLSYTPVLPICIAEDFQDLVYTLLPKHIPWPSPLVDTHDRVPQSIPISFGKPIQAAYINTADVQDCSIYGFGDGVHELIYGLDYLIPTWRTYFSSLTTSTFFGWDVTKELAYFQNKEIHSEIYKQCAALFSITAVPLILFVLLVLVFSLALLHVAFIVVKNILKAVKECFVALALAFIDLRDQT